MSPHASTERLQLAPPRVDAQGVRRPPGPRTWPVIGASVPFSVDALGTLMGYRQRYGDVVFMSLPLGDIYVFTHPEDIQSVLVGEHAHVVKDELTHMLSRFIGQGLLTSEGALWRRQRKIAAPSFQPKHIARYGEAMVQRARRYLAGLPAKSRRDVHVDMGRVTLEIVLDTMFGADTVSDIDGVGEIVDTLLTGYGREYLTWRRLLPRWMRKAANDKLDDARARLDAILYEIIGKRRGVESGDDDLLDRLLRARDDEGEGMSDEQLRDEVATVFLAGHETTALALSYALDLLARHPTVLRRLRQELDEVLAGRDPSAADLPALPYCDAVLRETMRLYPPAYLVGREMLEEREIAGYTVPKGAQLLTPQWVVHRDPRWYEAPEVFWPERWLDGLDKRLHRFAYFPFGGGPRICVGNHFAMLEGILVLATLIQGMHVRPLSPPHTLELSTSVTLRPVTGVWLDVERREG